MKVIDLISDAPEVRAVEVHHAGKRHGLVCRALKCHKNLLDDPMTCTGSQLRPDRILGHIPIAFSVTSRIFCKFVFVQNVKNSAASLAFPSFDS